MRFGFSGDLHRGGGKFRKQGKWNLVQTEGAPWGLCIFSIKHGAWGVQGGEWCFQDRPTSSVCGTLILQPHDWKTKQTPAVYTRTSTTMKKMGTWHGTGHRTDRRHRGSLCLAPVALHESSPFAIQLPGPNCPSLGHGGFGEELPWHCDFRSGLGQGMCKTCSWHLAGTRGLNLLHRKVSTDISSRAL